MSLEQTRPPPERAWPFPAALAGAAHALLPFLAIATVLVLWEGATRLFQVPTYIMPGPLAIWESLVRNWATLQKHATTTGIEALAGKAL